MWLWLKERWKVVLGSIVTLLGILSVYSRLRSQKQILQKANESHEKDNKINEKALRDVTSGLEKIEKDTVEELRDVDADHKKREKELSSDKDVFEEEALDNENLARDIAETLGAKYVKNKK